MRALLFVLPLLVSSLSLVSPADEEKVRTRLKAGRDINRFNQKIEEAAEKAEIEESENGEWSKHNTLRAVAKSAKLKHKKKKFELHKVAQGSEKLDLMDTYQNAEAVVEESYVKEDPSKAPFRPRMEIISSDFKVGKDTNVEVFWQRPEGKVKGVMFGATGCFHQGGDFFEQHHKDGWEFKECRDSKLRRCQGLPDNVYFFKYALARNYMVMTITPQGKNSCWEHQNDPKRVNMALQYVLKKEALPLDTPMFASGASQGGYFMFDMQKAEIPNLKCIAPQCAEIKDRTHKEHLPTMFIYMPKDTEIRGQVEQSIDYLRHRLNGKVAVRVPHPWAVHELMAARGFSEKRINATKEALQKAKGPFGHKPMSKNGYIVDHPGTDGWWKAALRKILTHKEDSLKKDHSVMHHVMQVAFAEHEFTAEYTDHIIDFCESGGAVNPNTPLRFGRKPGGGVQKFDVKASGVHGAHEK